MYKVYGALDQVENMHLPDEGHDYGPSKRDAMYRFMARHLRLNLAAVETPDGKIDESDTTLEPAESWPFSLPNIPVRRTR